MWLSVNLHTLPSVNGDLDVGSVNVLVGVDKVVAQDGSKQLWRGDWVLLGEDIDRLLLGVCGYDRRVVCFCVSI